MNEIRRRGVTRTTEIRKKKLVRHHRKLIDTLELFKLEELTPSRKPASKASCSKIWSIARKWHLEDMLIASVILHE